MEKLFQNRSVQTLKIRPRETFEFVNICVPAQIVDKISISEQYSSIIRYTVTISISIIKKLIFNFFKNKSIFQYEQIYLIFQYIVAKMESNGVRSS